MMKRLQVGGIISNIVGYLSRPERFFLFAALIAGGLFVILVPPFQNPDEDVHFYRAYQISRGELISPKVGNTTGSRLPTSIRETIAIVDSGRAGRSLKLENGKLEKTDIKAALMIRLNPSSTEPIEFPSSGLYSPVSYLPQSVGILFGRIFNVPPLILLYMGRIAGLLFYVFFVHMLIRQLAIRQWSLAILALLPMVLVGATALTADTVLNVAMMAYFVLIVNLTIRKVPASPKWLFLLVGVLAVIILSKQVFFVFALLLWPLSRQLIDNRKKRWLLTAAAIAIGMLPYVAWSYLAKDSLGSVANPMQHADVGAQIHGILRNPFHLATAYFESFVTSEGDGVYNSFAGNFGWLTAQMPSIGALSVWFGVFLALFVGYEKNPFVEKFKQMKWLVFATLLLSIAAVGGALYLAYTPVGYGKIIGMQGRYFIPMVIVALLVALGSRQSFTLSPVVYRRYARYTVFVWLLFTAGTLIGHYYWQ